MGTVAATEIVRIGAKLYAENPEASTCRPTSRSSTAGSRAAISTASRSTSPTTATSRTAPG